MGEVCLGAKCSAIEVEPPPRACDDSVDCTEKRPHCKENANICVQCLHDGHCPGTEVCVGESRCFPCKADWHCDTNLCVDFHCAACDTGAGLNCKPGWTCESGRCVQ